MGFEGRKGSPIDILANLKLNTKSSTTAELEDTDCAPPPVLWVPLFFKAQGHKVESNVVEQW